MIRGVVLAGGRSTRMGGDKATLQVAPGERLVDRVAAVVTAALRASGEPLPRILVSGEVAGYECVADTAPGLGPVAGLAAAVARIAAEPEPARWLLAVPVDLPALTPAALAPLLAQAGGDRAAVAYEGQPLPALLRTGAATAAALQATLAADRRDRSVWRVLERLGALRLPIDPAHAPALVSANTPDELRRALGDGGDR